VNWVQNVARQFGPYLWWGKYNKTGKEIKKTIKTFYKNKIIKKEILL